MDNQAETTQDLFEEYDAFGTFRAQLLRGDIQLIYSHGGAFRDVPPDSGDYDVVIRALRRAMDDCLLRLKMKGIDYSPEAQTRARQ